MRYYSAVVSKDEVIATCFQPPYYILASYHYWKDKKDDLKEYIAKGYSVFIDSGAFSAGNSGKVIDIDDYCKFLVDINATIYASLDVMGDAEATLANYNYMVENYPLKPIPTFHMGSEIKYLKPLLEFEYIALGGMVFSAGITNHCDEVWHYILTHKPKLKVHGFGLTNIELMKRYPWYSVDSSSFKSCKRFGRQNILWNGFQFKTFGEIEYLQMLEAEGFDVVNMENKQKWFLYDSRSSQAYKMYAEHLKEINKRKSFDYLTDQQKLF